MEKQHIDYKMEGGQRIMRPIGSLPNRCFGSSKNNLILDSKIRNANRYLHGQSVRISRHIMEGRMQAALLIGCMLAKNSISYQIYLFNKVYKEGYGKSTESEVMDSLLQCINKLRTGNIRTYMNRYYILKKNGKYRPIGAPDLPSKVLCRFLSDLCTVMLEGPRSGLAVSNHAYRPGKGRHTAVIELLENGFTVFFKYKQYPVIKEFDFKGYFNNVNGTSINVSLSRFTNSDLASLIQMYLRNVHTRIIEYKDETEFLLVGSYGKGKKEKNVYVRKGMPQGSPVSPVLATMACDMSAPPVGLTMYADDGVFIGKDTAEFDSGLKAGEESGRYIEHSKTREITNGTFKFCGYTISFTGEYIMNEEGDRCNLFTPKPELLEGLKKGSHYSKTEKPRWEGDVKYNSYCVHTKVSIFETGGITPLIWFFGFFRLEYRGYKGISFRGIYQVSTTSTESLRILLAQVKRIKNLKELKRIRALKFDYQEHPTVVKTPKNVKTHYEFNPFRYSPGVLHLFPGISVRDLMLSTRSMIGTAKYARKVENMEEFKKVLLGVK